MKVAGVIAEYNPFHEGHKYHIEKTKEITGADYVIVVMSGNFTQRGVPAIINKYTRAKQALKNGADLVIELPACFSTASAEYFAHAGVSILHKLGVVDYLSFGSEEGDIEKLKEIASFLSCEPDTYKKELQFYLKEGYSFPQARGKALYKYFPDLDLNFLAKPNNILGIEYCRALLTFHSSIKPITIPRISNQYHDSKLSLDSTISSASAIRNEIYQAWKHAGSVADKEYFSNETTCNISDKKVFSTKTTCDSLENIKDHVPLSVYQSLTQEWGKFTPIFSDDFSGLLKYKILLEQQLTFSPSTKEEGNSTINPTNSTNKLTEYFDVPSSLADRIKKQGLSFSSYEEFCESLKTKELTYSRISRSLLHILLDIKQADVKKAKENEFSPYARILGFRKDATPLLHEIKLKSSIPVITKLTQAENLLDYEAYKMLQKDIQASHIYETMISQKFGQSFRNEYRQQIIIL